MSSLRSWIVLSTLVAAFPVILEAQEPRPAAEPAPVADLLVEVTDAVSGAVMSGARVRLVEAGRAALTGPDGRHRFTAVPIGQAFLTVDQYAFGGVGVMLELSPGGGEVQIALEPRALEIEGLEVVTDRIRSFDRQLRRRRNGTAVSTRVFDQERLLSSGSFDMIEFLEVEPGLRIADCGAYYCVVRRGRLEVPQVYIDEVPIFRGMDQLRFYQPHELHLVEVYAQGREIRAYTHQFMERMVRRPMALLPVGRF
jgi:hypothetical protein